MNTTFFLLLLFFNNERDDIVFLKNPNGWKDCYSIRIQVCNPALLSTYIRETRVTDLELTKSHRRVIVDEHVAYH